MGTWGTGNFQNDGALDHVGDLVDNLAGQIDEILAGDNDADADESGESVLMPNVAIIAVLCDACHAAPPKPAKIIEWRKRYLAAFDRSMPGLDSRGDFTKPRREVVEQTFDRLLAGAREFWKVGED
jgi:hypothetical protein